MLTLTKTKAVFHFSSGCAQVTAVGTKAVPTSDLARLRPCTELMVVGETEFRDSQLLVFVD
jgi:hypothetical protein